METRNTCMGLSQFEQFLTNLLQFLYWQTSSGDILILCGVRVIKIKQEENEEEREGRKMTGGYIY